MPNRIDINFFFFFDSVASVWIYVSVAIQFFVPYLLTEFIFELSPFIVAVLFERKWMNIEYEWIFCIINTGICDALELVWPIVPAIV